jgi:hypothetical protein
MGAIIQTLTLAIILLIVGLVFTSIGLAGLMWRAGRDRRRIEQAEKAMTSGELVQPSHSLTVAADGHGAGPVTGARTAD